MKFIKKIKNIIEGNIMYQISICAFLFLMLIAIFIFGSIYSKKINNKNLAVNIEQIDNKEKVEELNDKDKKKEEEKTKKLNELKEKIVELDETIDITITESDIDKDLAYYENLYNELLEKNEEIQKVEESEEVTESEEDIYNELQSDESNGTSYDQESWTPNYNTGSGSQSSGSGSNSSGSGSTAGSGSQNSGSGSTTGGGSQNSGSGSTAGSGSQDSGSGSTSEDSSQDSGNAGAGEEDNQEDDAIEVLPDEEGENVEPETPITESVDDTTIIPENNN